MSGGGAEVRNRAMRREHNVRAVDCRVAIRMAGAMFQVKSASNRARQQASIQFVICPMQSI